MNESPLLQVENSPVFFKEDEAIPYTIDTALLISSAVNPGMEQSKAIPHNDPSSTSSQDQEKSSLEELESTAVTEQHPGADSLVTRKYVGPTHIRRPLPEFDHRAHQPVISAVKSSQK